MCEIQHSLESAHCQNPKVRISAIYPIISDIPFSELMDDPSSSLTGVPRDKPVYVICRFGNDSQLAVDTMQNMEDGFPNVQDVKGGLDAWAETFPTDIIPKY
jgi:rhodanese-related sulfurtransferase